MNWPIRPSNYAEEMAATGHAVYFTHDVGKKITTKFELAEVRRGRDTLYRMGPKKINSPGRP